MVEPFIGICILLWIGHWLRMRIKLLQKLYLPSCVIAGVIGLIIVQILRNANTPELTDFVNTWTAGWGKLPSFLINIVFACLFLGVTLPKISTLWNRAGPQLAYGQIVAWGQYTVGIGITLVLLAPLFGVPHMFGAIIPIGFEGGHGTAGGMGPVFETLGYPEGKDFALASATVGIMSAIIIGMVLINWAARRGHTAHKPKTVDAYTSSVLDIEERPHAGKLTISADAIETFTFHVAVVGIAIFIGWVGKQGLLGLDSLIGNKTFHVVAKSFPLFPLCMLGGLIVQLFEDKFDKQKLIDHGLTRRIQNSSLDFLVVAAISTINIKALIPSLAPFFILVTAGILWNIFCVLFLAKRLLPDTWFERSIAEMGQSMGVTATGLLLLRVVDPEYESPAADAFASKQLLHEPFMGGGLWTSSAVPLLAAPAIGGLGGLPVFLITVGAIVFWLIITFAFFKKRA